MTTGQRSPFAQLLHLAKRFFGSLRPGPPTTEDEEWASSHLLPSELPIWSTMSNPDRRHAVGVARAVAAELGPAATRPIMAAALLHDSGKTIAGFRTPARVGATVFWAIADDRTADRWLAWSGRSGLWHRAGRRLAQYRRHPELGAAALADAGSDALTIAWTREHHQPADRWSVDPTIAVVLKACDDD